ncbi:hypothetical protein FRC08_000668 [Ceratobasidium sp. 394]|nr:hypothetical protein FRC08_000668 [Ceratobasidium sp. 394]
MIEPSRSNVERVVGPEDNQGLPNDASEHGDVSEYESEPEEDNLFPVGDGDIILRIEGSELEAHRYILRKFTKLDAMIQRRSNRCNPTLVIHGYSAEDFRNTFQVLYASAIEGPFEFGTETLTSALRIATAFDYPALRNFAIKGLQRTSLGAAERVHLAREFDLASWEGPAYKELRTRDGPITLEEADTLGLGIFVDLAKAREKEQWHRGRLAGAAKQFAAGEPPQRFSNANSTVTPRPNSNVGAPHLPPPAPVAAGRMAPQAPAGNCPGPAGSAHEGPSRVETAGEGSRTRERMQAPETFVEMRRRSQANQNL